MARSAARAGSTPFEIALYIVFERNLRNYFFAHSVAATAPVWPGKDAAAHEG